MPAAGVERLGDEPAIVSPSAPPAWARPARRPSRQTPPCRRRTGGPLGAPASGLPPVARPRRTERSGSLRRPAGGPCLVGAGDARRRVARRRIDDGRLLVDGLVHRGADGAHEIRPLADVGRMGHRAYANAAPPDEPDAHAVAGEPGGDRRDERRGRGDETARGPVRWPPTPGRPEAARWCERAARRRPGDARAPRASLSPAPAVAGRPATLAPAAARGRGPPLR